MMLKEIWCRITFNRRKAGADAAFDAVLQCLNVLDNHRHPPDTMETDSVKRAITNDLRRVIKQMKGDS